jgi:hypothetical protein
VLAPPAGLQGPDKAFSVVALKATLEMPRAPVLGQRLRD